MDSTVFDRTIDALHTYSEIYRNINQGSPFNYDVTNQSRAALETMIRDMVLHLKTNAEGQI